MKKSCYWVKGVAAVSMLLVLLVVGCGFWIQKNEKLSGQSKVQEASGTYGVSADDCALCGNIRHLYKDEDNLGIIYMAGGELLYVEINRYDTLGKLIEKPSGYMSMDTMNTKDGIKTTLTVNSDRGYARAKISMNAQNKSDKDKAWALCDDCLKLVCKNSSVGESYGIGLINFKTGEVKLLDAQVKGFLLGDYYVACSACEGESGTDMELEIVMFYCPERYGK